MDIMNTAIEVRDISKTYKLYEKPVDRLKEAINPFGRTYHRLFTALNHLNFSIKRGEMVGIIGKNGSGKSTLLKIITGVLSPSSGSVNINGRISALLELGAGFNPEYTGIENIYLNGTIMGLAKAEVDAKINEVVAFADIGDFINQPVKMYSSGMFVRLAFAVAISIDPDILIIDEALSVGDMRFQQKCFRKIEEFRNTKTVLFVSHDLGTINKYCDRAIWINEGNLMYDGDALEAAKQYQAFMIGTRVSKTDEEVTTSLDVWTGDSIEELPSNLDVQGDKSASIIGISLFDNKSDKRIEMVEAGQFVKLLIRIRSNINIQDPIIGFSVKDRLGNVVAQSNSLVTGNFLDELIEGTIYTVGFTFQMPNLNHGEFTISPAVASGSQEAHIQHCWVHDAVVFQVYHRSLYQLNGFLTLEGVQFYLID